jgi:hypothetical protein
MNAAAQGRSSSQAATARIADWIEDLAATHEACSTVGGGTTQDKSRVEALQKCATDVVDLSRASLEHYRRAESAAPKDLERTSTSWSTIKSEVDKNPCPADTSKVVTP